MIPRSFFTQDPLTCARKLIGCELIWGRCSGIIVETEAYTALGDEACHTFLRPSVRAFVAAHRAGDSYVYLNYGMHWMLNVLVKEGSEEGFVLIRALEPMRGLAAMRERRSQLELRALCSGPGKLAQALGITGADHGRDLCRGKSPGFRQWAEPPGVVADVRIGITKSADLPWRYLLSGSRFASVRASAAAALCRPAPLG